LYKGFVVVSVLQRYNNNLKKQIILSKCEEIFVGVIYGDRAK